MRLSSNQFQTAFFWSYQYLPVAQGDSFRVLTPGCVTPVYWEPSSCFSSSSTAAGGCTRSQAWRRLSATGDKNICTCSTLTLFFNLNLNLDFCSTLIQPQPCVNIDEKNIFWSTLCRPGLLLYPVNSWCYPANSQVSKLIYMKLKILSELCQKFSNLEYGMFAIFGCHFVAIQETTFFAPGIGCW